MKFFLSILILNTIIFSYEAESLSAQQKMQKEMIMAKARTIKKMQEGTEVIEEKTLKTVLPIKVDVTKSTEHVPLRKSIIKTEGKTSMVKVSKKTPHVLSRKKRQEVCKSSKKSLRELEISQALSFYKKSSFYRFRK